MSVLTYAVKSVARIAAFYLSSAVLNASTLQLNSSALNLHYSKAIATISKDGLRVRHKNKSYYALMLIETMIASMKSYFNIPNGLVALIFLIYFMSGPLKLVYNRSKARLVSILLSRTALITTSLRKTFRTVKIRYVKPIKHHTHGKQASIRTSAREAITNLVRQTGREQYIIQPTAMQSLLHDGQHDIYWSKDVETQPRTDILDVNKHIRVVQDTDFHIPLIEWENTLATTPCDTLIYTFVPEAAASIEDDGSSHTFNSKMQLIYTVPGGGEYQHTIYDYGTDTLLTTSNGYTTVYNVERRVVGTHHQLICLSPFAHAFGALSIMMNRQFNDKRLKVFNPIRGDYIIMDTISEDQRRLTSIARIEDYTAVTIDTSLFERFCNMYRNSKQGPVRGSILTHLGEATEKNQDASALLYDFLSNHNNIDRPKIYNPRYDGKYYTFGFEVDKDGVPHDQGPIDGDVQPLMKPFMAPLNPNTYIPARTIDSEIAGVITRVELMPTAKTAPTDAHLDLMEFFAKKIFPSKIHPVSIEEVRVRQSRPSQRMIWTKADLENSENSKCIASSFNKGETYLNVKDPRTVTIEPGPHKIEYARYHYAIMDALKAQPWYAFGKTPKELETRIAYITKGCKHLTGEDVVRQDGMQSMMLRALQRVCAQVAFEFDQAKKLNKLHADMRGLKTYTSFGFKYFLQLVQGSGFMDTADWNSINEAWRMFLTCILMDMTREDAWTHVLQHYAGGGDDSIYGHNLDFDVFTEYSELAAQLCGQNITRDNFVRGQPFDFFARYYGPSTWEGEPNSCADIARALSKLASAPAGNDPLLKLAQKLGSLALTDKNTPGVSNLIQKWQELDGDFDNIDPLSWWSQFDKSTQFTNNLEDWMLALADHQGLQYDWLIRQLREVLSQDQLLEMQPVYELAPLKPLKVRFVIMDGEDSQLVEPVVPLEELRAAIVHPVLTPEDVAFAASIGLNPQGTAYSNKSEKGKEPLNPEDQPQDTSCKDTSTKESLNNTDASIKHVSETISLDIGPQLDFQSKLTFRPKSPITDRTTRKLVISPSCSGKTTFILENPACSLIDLDQVISWPKDKTWKNPNSPKHEEEIRIIAETIQTWLKTPGDEIGFYSTTYGILHPDAVVIISDKLMTKRIKKRSKDDARTDRTSVIKELLFEKFALHKEYEDIAVNNFNILLSKEERDRKHKPVAATSNSYRTIAFVARETILFDHPNLVDLSDKLHRVTELEYNSFDPLKREELKTANNKIIDEWLRMCGNETGLLMDWLREPDAIIFPALNNKMKHLSDDEYVAVTDEHERMASYFKSNKDIKMYWGLKNYVKHTYVSANENLRGNNDDKHKITQTAGNVHASGKGENKTSSTGKQFKSSKKPPSKTFADSNTQYNSGNSGTNSKHGSWGVPKRGRGGRGARNGRGTSRTGRAITSPAGTI